MEEGKVCLMVGLAEEGGSGTWSSGTSLCPVQEEESCGETQRHGGERKR